MTGLFTDASMIRQVHREHVVSLAGPRALLMQAAHPVAFSGFFASTTALADPHARLERTARVLSTIVFGPREAAEHATRRVRRVHSRMRGRLERPAGRFPAGTPWAADDPRLLLWVVATLVDSALLVHDRYVRVLSHAEREAYWHDYKTVARLFGIPNEQLPPTIDDLDAHVGATLAGHELFVTPQARELAIQVVLRPSVPLAARPLLELANFVTIGLLPDVLRRQYGLGWDPLRGLVHRGGAEYTKRVVVPLLPNRLRYARRQAAA
jgi:uncharacterized protein (DUF2236 family)